MNMIAKPEGEKTLEERDSVRFRRLVGIYHAVPSLAALSFVGFFIVARYFMNSYTLCAVIASVPAFALL